MVVHRRTELPQFSGIPGFFRACYKDAARGGRIGYFNAGRDLARHLRDLIPYELEDAEEEWLQEIEFLLRPHIEVRQPGVASDSSVLTTLQAIGAWRQLFWSSMKCSEVKVDRRYSK